MSRRFGSWSATNSGPAAERIWAATPVVEACARCAVPKRVEHEEIGQPGERLGESSVV